MPRQGRSRRRRGPTASLYGAWRSAKLGHWDRRLNATQSGNFKPLVFGEIHAAGNIYPSLRQKLGRPVLHPSSRAARARENRSLRSSGTGSSPASHSSSGATVADSARPVLRPESVARFSPAVASALDDLRLDVTTTPIPVAVERIRTELTRLTPAFDRIRRSTLANVGRVGSQFFTLDLIADLTGIDGRPSSLPDPSLPDTHGTIKPVGMADLLVVKHQLVR